MKPPKRTRLAKAALLPVFAPTEDRNRVWKSAIVRAISAVACLRPACGGKLSIRGICGNPKGCIDMTLTIDLTPDQQAALEAEATARGIDLPELVRRRLTGDTPKSGMTPREILAYWAEDQSPSVFGRTNEDAVTIARRLRQQAERRNNAI